MSELDQGLGLSAQFVILSVQKKIALGRRLGRDQIAQFRVNRVWDVVPGEIATVVAKRPLHFDVSVNSDVKIQSTKLDVGALGLVPLRLKDQGLWNPEEQFWGDDGPTENWQRAVIAWGPRQFCEMEQVLPGEDPEDAFSDPIIESNDLKESGDASGARVILMDLCRSDLRCLDAHAHLGNLAFDRLPQQAIRHYEVGFRIGELSLGTAFDGVLPWGCLDNRPFLRCMIGFGFCLWRIGRFVDAARIFERMLWLNPSDNQGVRFLVDEVSERVAWSDRSEQ